MNDSASDKTDFERSVCDGKCDGDDCRGAYGGLCGGEIGVVESKKLYTVSEVAIAIGMDQHKVAEFFSRRGYHARDGISLEQAYLVSRTPLKYRGVKWENVREIKKYIENKRAEKRISKGTWRYGDPEI